MYIQSGLHINEPGLALLENSCLAPQYAAHSNNCDSQESCHPAEADLTHSSLTLEVPLYSILRMSTTIQKSLNDNYIPDIERADTACELYCMPESRHAMQVACNSTEKSRVPAS